MNRMKIFGAGVAIIALAITSVTTADAKVKKGGAVTVSSRDGGSVPVGPNEYKVWREGDVIHLYAWLKGDAARSAEADHDRAWLRIKDKEDGYEGRKLAAHVFRFDFPNPDADGQLLYFEGRRGGKVSWPWPPLGPAHWESSKEIGLLFDFPASGNPVPRGN